MTNIINPYRFGGGSFSWKGNFRGTAGYVTDAADEHFIGNISYPTTVGGVSVGWETAPTGVRDRNSSIDRRFAGVHFNNSASSVDFRIDLPAVGNYRIHVGIYDAAYGPANHKFALLDATTIFENQLTNPQSSTNGPTDASGVQHADIATWIASENPVDHAFSSTIFRFRLAGVSAIVVVSHIFVESI